MHLSVSSSQAHCQSIKINVIAQQPESRGRNAPIEVTTKADIVKVNYLLNVTSLADYTFLLHIHSLVGHMIA